MPKAGFALADTPGPQVVRIAPRGSRSGPQLVSEQLSLFHSDQQEIKWALEAYREVVWSYAAISQIGNDLSNLPYVIRKGPLLEDPIVESSAATELLAEPNDTMSASDLFEAIAIYTMAGGRCYNWLATRDGKPLFSPRAVPEAIFPMRPDLVTVKTRPPVSIESYVYRSETGEEFTAPPSDMVVIKFFDPLNPYTGGLSPLTPAKLSIWTDLQAAKWNGKFFKNGATPGLIVTDENPISQEEYERFKREVKSTWVGSENAFQFLYLANFKGKIESFKADHKDMGFIELVKSVRRDQLAAIGCPPAIAGEFDGLDLAQVDMQERIYWTKTMVPLCRRIENALNRFLMKRIDPGMFFRFDLSGVKVLQPDLTAKVQREAVQIRNGLRSRAELREDDGLEPYPGSEKFLISAGLVDPEARPEPASSPEAGDDSSSSPASPGSDDDDPADEPARALISSVTRSLEAREIQRADMWRGFDKRLRQAEREMLAVWGPVLDGMADHVVRRVREIAPTISSSVGSRARADTPPSLLTPLPGHPFDYLPDADALVRTVVAEHGVAYEAIVRRFGTAAIEAIASRLVFDEGTSTLLTLVERDAVRVGAEVDRLLAELRDTLEGGINSGETIGDLVDRIRTRVSPARAERIARTEAIAAANSGTVEGYRQAGVEQHEWLSSRDAYVRDSHNGLDGQVVNVGAPFEIRQGPNAGATILFPGDPAGPVGEIVNCRCTVMPLVGAA